MKTFWDLLGKIIIAAAIIVAAILIVEAIGEGAETIRNGLNGISNVIL